MKWDGPGGSVRLSPREESFTGLRAQPVRMRATHRDKELRLLNWLARVYTTA